MLDRKYENGCSNCAAPEVAASNAKDAKQAVNPWAFNLQCGCWDGWYGLAEVSTEKNSEGDD